MLILLALLVSVPKNYADPSAGVANISLTRRRATQSPKRGTMFYNPGGPGGFSAAVWVAQNIDYLADRIGPQWDIVGFDPRGIANST